MLRPDESVKYDFWVGGISFASFSVYMWRGGEVKERGLGLQFIICGEADAKA